MRRISAKFLIMTASAPTAPPACHLYKVSLTVPASDHVSYCVGLGVGPSEDVFREWLHRRVTLSRMPFLWAQVEQVQLDTGSDLERLMHMMAYASGCSPFRQVFWRGDEVTLPDSSERFLQGVAAGESAEPGGGCALLLAGKAVADFRLASPALAGATPPPETGHAEPSRDASAISEQASMGWATALTALWRGLRRRVAYLWMAW